jgi:hypothetical protein
VTKRKLFVLRDAVLTTHFTQCRDHLIVCTWGSAVRSADAGYCDSKRVNMTSFRKILDHESASRHDGPVCTTSV